MSKFTSKNFKFFILIIMFLFATAFIAAQLNLFDVLAKLPSKVDSDQDYLTHFQEARYGTDPNDSDTDDGGTKDGHEVTCGLDPLVDYDDFGDLNNDGDITFSGEEYTAYRCVTEQLLKALYDQDVVTGHDGDIFVPDDDIERAEWLKVFAKTDTDNDGLTYIQEVALGTDPSSN